MTSLRITTRTLFSITGNVPEDFFSALIFYPSCALQLDLTTENFSIDSSSKQKKKSIEDSEDIGLEVKGKGTAPSNGVDNLAFVEKSEADVQ